MNKYTDVNELYKKAVAWEAVAFVVLKELNNKPFEEMSEKEKLEWVKWSVILAERTAFKFDVADAPAANVRENIHGEWKQGYCSECRYNWGKDAPITSVPNFCPNCGADMREGRDDAKVH